MKNEFILQNVTIVVRIRDRVTHYAYGFKLINDEATLYLANPKENDYSMSFTKHNSNYCVYTGCSMEPWWGAAYWTYILLVVINMISFFFGASLWHTVGITCSMQICVFLPFVHTY